MPTTHLFAVNELPSQYQPYGYEWLRRRLAAVGYTNPRVWEAVVPGQTQISVDENNVSKNQLLFDIQPSDGRLAANYTTLNLPPGSSTPITITGPVGKLVKVRFDGVCFVTESQFVIPANNNYEFMVGPCPVGMCVVSPQLVDFYVEDESCSPVSVRLTFK